MAAASEGYPADSAAEKDGLVYLPKVGVRVPPKCRDGHSPVPVNAKDIVMKHYKVGYLIGSLARRDRHRRCPAEPQGVLSVLPNDA